MRPYFSFFCLLGFLLGAGCSEEKQTHTDIVSDTLQPAPYLYKPPVTAEAGLPTAKLKKEDLAEAFVSRLSMKQPAGIVVMQQEKLVLEEYFNLDSTALVCVEAAFPAYSGALLGRMYRQKQGVPYQPIPLHLLYPEQAPSQAIPLPAPARPYPESSRRESTTLEQLIQQNMNVSHGFAAEELLFEPLQIDDYQWQDGSLCLHPHAMLQLASLWVRRGRWNNEQLLPDLLIQRVLQPAYENPATAKANAFGWQYYRLVAKGRKHPVILYKEQDFALFLFPEVEAVALLQGQNAHLPEAWAWLQQYLIPSLMP